VSDSVRVGARQIYDGWVIVAALSVTETVVARLRLTPSGAGRIVTQE